MSNIKPGIVVQLKSGGPYMTVEDYSCTGRKSESAEDKSWVICSFFDKEETFRLEKFPVLALKEVMEVELYAHTE